jgi:hypothetical protein
MNTLFDFEETPQEHKPPRDWQGNEIPVSDNPCVRLYGIDPQGRKCKDCKNLTKYYYHGYTYIKCDLRKLTHGKGSDHRVKWDACKRFEQEEDEK